MSTRRDRLRPDVALVEQVYRGERSFIAKDPATRRYFRFRPVEALVIAAFDGTRTAAEIAAGLAEQGLKISAAAVEGFADKLRKLGLMERSLAERTTLQLERLRAERKRRRAWFRGELLRMRWSVKDPDRFFSRLLPSLRWCFTRGFVAVSVLLFAVYFVILAVTWTDFTRTTAALYSPSTLTVGAIAVLVLTFLTIAAVHELAHGFTCKYFGGEVHELGFMLLYFEPAFYCNVNDAWSFPELRARLWVTAAGLWVQLVLAGLAAIVWWTAVPGTLVSEVAVAAMLAGGATSVLTNLNPLLPLDGYFALSDYLDIPNLRARALGYVGWWFRRRVLRIELPEPTATERERRVFALYGGLAVIYIATVFLFIAGLVFGWARRVLGALGGLLVVAAVLMLVRRPLREWRRAVAFSLRAHRAAWKGSPVWRRLAAALLVITLLAAAIPWPLTTSGVFTSAPALMLALTAPDSGVVAQVYVREGTRVEAGAPLVELVDLGLARERAARERTADSLAAHEARARALGMAADAERLAAERVTAVAELAALQSRLDALSVRARARGVVTTRRPEELFGRRLESGDTVVTLSDLDSVEIRIALSGGGAALVRAGQTVRLISYADVGRSIRATIASVSALGGGAAQRGGVEARVRLPTRGAWRPGVSGEASVELSRSNILGALWWAMRKRVRSDLLL